ncbi:hypothetical protein [Polaromonas jejuensis]|uniref:Uncharacterized protein n=1 Tax=Polaromonas jejuensis TaxID=457502 RepID=A0ABW0QEC3_9BURK|nr:hypothetical protein [Polaromonas jejuensis]
MLKPKDLRVPVAGRREAFKHGAAAAGAGSLLIQLSDFAAKGDDGKSGGSGSGGGGDLPALSTPKMIKDVILSMSV